LGLIFLAGITTFLSVHSSQRRT